MTLRILNLYAGIGGNRKLWSGDIKVTAVELNPDIAKIYKDFFPDDEVIVADAHQYLLDHYKEYDFIWSSPPCPTHSRMRLLKMEQNAKPVFPDMKLYEEIIFLSSWFDGKWVIENVVSYYEPLIKPFICNNHYFWSNFFIDRQENEKRGIIRISRAESIRLKEEEFGFDISSLEISETLKQKITNNAVPPKTGLYIFNMAFKEKQVFLTDVDKYPPLSEPSINGELNK